MNMPLMLADFQRIAPPRARLIDGLAVAIDAVAARAAPSHRFLRHGWYAAAVVAYGGRPRTVLVEEDGAPVLALPFVGVGPRALGLAAIPGCYWPYRSFVIAQDAGEKALEAALETLAGHVRALRIGPVADDDAAVAPLIAVARAKGWAVLDRYVADGWLLDIAAARHQGPWPRGSTLRKNRFHEKHLAEQGALDWRYLTGDDWPGAFAMLGAVEARSWVASATDGRDAKFSDAGHLAFWRAAVADPVLAKMFRAALLTIDARPAAFSFDIDVTGLRYAIANSYDPAFARHSPGKLLYWRNLVDGAARGIERVDWGMGDSGYKQVIGAERGAPLSDWLMLRPGWPAMIGGVLGRAWRRSGNLPA